MVKKYETDLINRYHAGAEAIRLLEEAGFNVHDGDVNVKELHDVTFDIEASLSVEQETYPLQSLEDESDDFGQGFMLGLMAGMMMPNFE